jgi:serine/threonine-protein kinase
LNQSRGQTLGKYELAEEIGRGGFATVYKATDSVLKRDIALKILHPALLADPIFVERFENDARAAAQLDHPHIITVYDLGHLEGRLYIAMQLLPGGTLASRIERAGSLPLEEAMPIILEVAAALEYAHSQGFVHRDIKPTNVLFNARGEAIVTDFGLVKAAESSVVARSSVGGVVGTPAYIAPEIWEGKGVGPGADIYALGCVLYEMLIGQALFQGDTSPAVMMAHFQPHQYPEEWPAGVPSEIECLLERALARDPAERYANASAFSTDLRELVAKAADPLAEPYRSLQTAMAAEKWEEALAWAQQISAQDLNYRNVSDLAQQAAEAQARVEQAQWATQWRDQALEAEKDGQLEAARVAAQRWLDMAPEDARATALMKRLTIAPREPVKSTLGVQEKEESDRRLLLIPILGMIGGMLLVLLAGFLLVSHFRADSTPTATAWAILPSDSPTPNLTSSPKPMLSSAETPTDVPIAKLTATLAPTLTPAPTVTPRPTQPPRSTASLAPTLTPAPTVTPRPTQPPQPTAIRNVATATALSDPAPTLDSPPLGAPLTGRIAFRWSHPGLSLGRVFQVLIWKEGNQAHNGAASYTTQKEQLISLDDVPQIRDGGVGTYYWTVVVVNEATDQRLAEAPSRRFEYVGSQGTREKPTKAPLTATPKP